MIFVLRNLRLGVRPNLEIKKTVCKKLNLPFDTEIAFKILRRAVDTRTRNQPVYDFTLLLQLPFANVSHPDLAPYQKEPPVLPKLIKQADLHPFIIGMGPAGLFCALAMVKNGLQPYLFDRGECIETRAEQVNDFWDSGKLNTQSNVQFGEGGAGAFSDGKLTSRSSNFYIDKVYEHLIEFGADKSISYEALPHLGTDGIRQVVVKIRQYLIENGCRFFYGHQLDDLQIKNEKVVSVTLNGEVYQPETVILALGNAARDTFRLLHRQKVNLEAKPFSVGFRISHPQEWINYSIYGPDNWAHQLGAATYRLTAGKAGKGTYSFCMCPGGYIINAASEADSCVTNGVSYADRDTAEGNSAIVTNVNPADYGNGLWSGMEFQAKIEQAAFLPGYAAPALNAADYLTGKLSTRLQTIALFPALKPFRISTLFSNDLNNALKSALKSFDYVMPGFINEGVIIAPETRTSCPIRILRDETSLSCHQISNLYAIGEGSGYAGGIISSAADGYKIGMKFTV